MQKRRRFKQTTSLHDRLAEFVGEARVEVDRAPPERILSSCSRRFSRTRPPANIEGGGELGGVAAAGVIGTCWVVAH